MRVAFYAFLVVLAIAIFLYFRPKFISRSTEGFATIALDGETMPKCLIRDANSQQLLAQFQGLKASSAPSSATSVAYDEFKLILQKLLCIDADITGSGAGPFSTYQLPFATAHDIEPAANFVARCSKSALRSRDVEMAMEKFESRGKELIDRILTGAEQTPENQEQAPQSARSENRFQKIINTNRDLAKENQTLKARVEKLLDEVHGYQVEGELVGSILDTQERAKRQAPPQNAAERHLKPKPFSVVDEAKKEMLKYLSTREDEIDHTHKSVLFLKYMQDPFYMNVFVQNNQPEQWQNMIESIYEAIGRPEPSFGGIKPMATHSPQPIRARTSTLGAPLASAGNPMDRIAQHLGNMGI